MKFLQSNEYFVTGILLLGLFISQQMFSIEMKQVMYAISLIFRFSTGLSTSICVGIVINTISVMACL